MDWKRIWKGKEVDFVGTQITVAVELSIFPHLSIGSGQLRVRMGVGWDGGGEVDIYFYYLNIFIEVVNLMDACSVGSSLIIPIANTLKNRFWVLTRSWVDVVTLTHRVVGIFISVFF